MALGNSFGFNQRDKPTDDNQVELRRRWEAALPSRPAADRNAANAPAPIRPAASTPPLSREDASPLQAWQILAVTTAELNRRTAHSAHASRRPAGGAGFVQWRSAHPVTSDDCEGRAAGFTPPPRPTGAGCGNLSARQAGGGRPEPDVRQQARGFHWRGYQAHR